jgi:hypothetical protein
VIGRRQAPPGRGFEYHLTDASRELEPLIMMLGEWGGPLGAQPAGARGTST